MRLGILTSSYSEPKEKSLSFALETFTFASEIFTHHHPVPEQGQCKDNKKYFHFTLH